MTRDALLVERACGAFPAAVAIEPVSLAEALPRQRRRAEQLAGRAAARRAAAALLGPEAAAAVDCRRSPEGPPELVVGGAAVVDVAVTIAHAGGIAAAAAAHRAAVGLDVEPVTAVEPALLERMFTASERRWIAAAPSADGETTRALQVWTAKEAVLKALRTGLRLPPARVEVDPVAGRASAFGAIFRIRSLVVAGYVLTLAVGRG